MSSLVRMCSSALLVTLVLTTQGKAESYSADLLSSKIVGTSLRAYTVANPESKDLITTNINWALTQIAESKKHVGSKNLSTEMKLKVASDSYRLMMNALVRLTPAIEDQDLKKAARDRLINYKKIVDSKKIGEIYKTLNTMELEITSVISAYNSF